MMLKSRDVLALVKAGYTKEEIQMMDQEPAPVQPDDGSEPEPAQVVINEPEEVHDKKSEMSPEDMYSVMLMKMQEMLDDGLKNIQRANISAAVMPEDHPVTPEDLIAKIIDPKPGKK